MTQRAWEGQRGCWQVQKGKKRYIQNLGRVANI